MKSTGAIISDYKDERGSRTSLSDEEMADLVRLERSKTDAEIQQRIQQLEDRADEIRESDDLTDDAGREFREVNDKKAFLEYLSEPQNDPIFSGGNGRKRNLSPTSNRGAYERGETCVLRDGMSAREWVQNREGSFDPAFEEVSLGAAIRAHLIGPETEAEERALSEGTDSAGGFTVPTILQADVLDALVNQSVLFEAGAERVMLGDSDTINMAKVSGLPGSTWHAEGAQESMSSDPTFEEVTFSPKTLMSIIPVSRELLQDSQNIEEALERAFIQQLSEDIQSVALIGGGSNEPDGIQQESSRQTKSSSTGTWDYDDLFDLVESILSAPGPFPDAAIESPRNWSDRSQLKDGSARYINAPDALRGMEFHQTESLPEDQGTGNDETSVFVGNFDAVKVGFRTDGVLIDSDPGFRMDRYEMTFLAHARLDVAVTYPAILGELDSLTN